MGGKRPDQYAIDPGEAGATDYKDRRQQDFTGMNKEHVENSMKDARQGDNLIPQGGVNPALAELRARNDRDAAEARGDHNRGGGLHGGATAAQQVNNSPDAGIEVRGAERADDAERTE